MGDLSDLAAAYELLDSKRRQAEDTGYATLLDQELLVLRLALDTATEYTPGHGRDSQ